MELIGGIEEMLLRMKREPRTNEQVSKFQEVLKDHPTAQAVIVPDEKTGKRWGNAECRKGRCEKLGYTTYRYQIWATW